MLMSQQTPTPERIVEAAIAAIEVGGEAGLRIDAVAREAGITKPSIYYFFGDRDGLVAAAQAERYRRSLLNGLVEAIELTRAATSRQEFEALLPAYVDTVMAAAGARRRAERIQVLGSAVSRPRLTEEVTAATERALELTTELVQIPVERGWATPAYDADAIALWWLSNSQGRHLVDLVANERLHMQWRVMTIAMLRHLFFGEL
jgi:AcrR family transcriptional regulator